MRKKTFSVRVINPWNSLPDYVYKLKHFQGQIRWSCEKCRAYIVKIINFKNSFLLPKMESKRNQNNITIFSLGRYF